MKSLDVWLRELSEAERRRYEFEMKSWSEEKRGELEALLNRFAAAGLASPWEWAYSEVKSGLPQFARFLFLNSIKDEVARSRSLLETEVSPTLIKKLKATLSTSELDELATSFAHRLALNFLTLIDFGHPERTRDRLSWILSETDSSLVPTGRTITGLNENFGSP